MTNWIWTVKAPLLVPTESQNQLRADVQNISVGVMMHEEIGRTVKAYLKARKDLIEVAAKYPEEMRGNDNIIGRIGEYLALQFYRSEGRYPTKTKCLSQVGFDLEESSQRISVKLLTSENVRGRGMRLTDPWDEFLLIHLSMADLSGTIGIITREKFEFARTVEPKRSPNPVVCRGMLNIKRGLIGKYGVVKEIQSFLETTK